MMETNNVFAKALEQTRESLHKTMEEAVSYASWAMSGKVKYMSIFEVREVPDLKQKITNQTLIRLDGTGAIKSMFVVVRLKYTYQGQQLTQVISVAEVVSEEEFYTIIADREQATGKVVKMNKTKI